MSLKDLSIIKKGSLILKPGQRSDISRAQPPKPQITKSESHKRDPDAKMDNPKLAALSNKFMDDKGCEIDKRCFCLIAGDFEDAKSNAFALSASFNIFDDHTIKKKADIRSHLIEVIVEMCPEIVKSISQLIPEFKSLFRFNDLQNYK